MEMDRTPTRMEKLVIREKYRIMKWEERVKRVFEKGRIKRQAVEDVMLCNDRRWRGLRTSPGCKV